MAQLSLGHYPVDAAQHRALDPTPDVSHSFKAAPLLQRNMAVRKQHHADIHT